MTQAAVAPSLLPKQAKARIAFAFYAAVLLEGTMLASIGPTLDALADQSGSTTGQISILFTANSLGFVSGSLLAGRLYAGMSGTSVLAVALAGMSALTVTIPFLGSIWLMILVFAVIGLSIGLIDVGGNTLLVWLFRKDVPPYMNALHLAFGIGAFLCPLVVDRFAVATDDAATAFWLFAGLMIPVALWVSRLPSPDSPPETAAPAAGSAVVRRYALFLGLMGALFFMHVGAELAFGGWIFSYADELNIGGSTTARVLNSVFWGGLVLGRLVAIPLSTRLTPRAMLQLDLLGALGALVLIELLPDWSPALWIGTAVFGMAIASMFASCINYAEERMPITSQGVAIFVVGAGVGSMTLPWVAGQLFERQGPETLIWLVGVAIVAGIALFASIQIHAARMGKGAESAA